ncbi:MAG: DUF5131 family protein [Gammaproteobacteria bacterium]
MDPTWVFALRDQCQRARVPFFFKQWSGKNKKRVGSWTTALGTRYRQTGAGHIARAIYPGSLPSRNLHARLRLGF